MRLPMYFLLLWRPVSVRMCGARVWRTCVAHVCGGSGEHSCSCCDNVTMMLALSGTASDYALMLVLFDIILLMRVRNHAVHATR